MNETNIGRPQLHPSIRDVIERARAQTFELQRWRPGCGHCGDQASEELDVAGARAWWAAHQDDCVACRVAA